MFTCKFCSEQIVQGNAVELNNPEVVLMLNFIKVEYKKLVTEKQITYSCSRCMNYIRTTYNLIMLCTKTEIKLRNSLSPNEFCHEVYPDFRNILEVDRTDLGKSASDICRICLVKITDFYYNIRDRCFNMPHTIEKMLRICFSSINLSITKDLHICDACVKSLIIAFSFYEKNRSLMTTTQNELFIKEIYNDNIISRDIKEESPESNTQDPEDIVLPDVIYIKQEPYASDMNEEIKLEDNTEHLIQNADGSSRPYRPVSKRYFCQTCSYTTKRKACLIKHKIVHFPDYKKPIFKCKDCGYTVKSQKYLDRHMSQHASGIDFKKFKCELCPFSTKKRSKLERHSTVHKDERETIMYKCSKCMFITKWKGYLTQHELTHNETEEKRFKCEHCEFSTNWRGSLLQHQVVHLSGDDAFKYSCDQCPFKTKRKDNLSKHMIRHMKDEDVRIFYCSECPFTSKFSSKLARHMHVHKRGDELTTYSCTECDFQTRWKNNLQQHMRVHQDASEISVFKCKDCPFTTKWKTCLTEHEVMHKTGDDSKEYKCTECNFTTKWKKSLNMHLLTHTTDESIKKFKCSVCEYKTYRSHHLKRHMQVHLK